MYGLNSTLSLASQALSADSGALAVTNNNVANVNTPGYARQIVNLTASGDETSPGAEDGGVTFNGSTSVRDKVLQLAINQKTSDASSLQTQASSWTQIQSAFSDPSSGLGASVNDLFSSLSSLSTAPDDDATRQAALSSAGDLVNAFHQAAAALSAAQASADSSVSGVVSQVNALANQIASLNQQLATTPPGNDGGNLQSQRDSLTTQLSQLVGISQTSTNSAPTLSLGAGSPLVIGTAANVLKVSAGPDGTTRIIDSQGNDVTGSIKGGTLGGALAMRDGSIPPLTSALNQFASQFALAMNTAQAAGYDQNGNPGQPIFSIPADGVNAASRISLSLANASSLAASSDGDAGSSGNVPNILSIQTEPLPSGQNPTDTLASFVENIGSASADVNSSLAGTNATLSQLTSQQSSESGVSIDEETTNLLRYQQAYAAAAKVISVVNDLYSTLMNM